MAHNIMALQRPALRRVRTGQNIQECLGSLQTSQAHNEPLRKYNLVVARMRFKTRKPQWNARGKPTSVTDTNVAAVSRVVDANPRMTYQQIRHKLDIRSLPVKAVLKDRLCSKTLRA